MASNCFFHQIQNTLALRIICLVDVAPLEVTSECKEFASSPKLMTQDSHLKSYIAIKVCCLPIHSIGFLLYLGNDRSVTF